MNTLPNVWNYEPAIVRYHFFTDKPQFELPVDTHMEWSAFIVEQGEFSYCIKDCQGTAGSGSMVVCPPDTPFHRSTAHPITFHFLVFHWLNGTGEPLPRHLYPTHVKWAFRNTSRLQSTLSLLRNPPSSPTVLSEHWRNHLFNDLLRLQWMEQMSPAGACLNETGDALMDKAKEAIDQTYDRPCRVHELADSFGLSPVQFARRFQRTFGMNPSEYAARLRLQKTCHLLTHTRLTIEEIAQQCGFSNGFYLSRVFAEKMRKTPTEYRAEHRV